MAKKKTAKKPRQRDYPSRELYEGYYWLILTIDPHKAEWTLTWECSRDLLGFSMPKCVTTAMKETASTLNYNYSDEGGTLIGYYTGGKTYNINFDELFRWFIGKNDRFLHTADGKPIVCTQDLKKLWADAGVGKVNTRTEIKDTHMGYSWRTYEKYHFDRLQAYLCGEHKKNLKEFETPAPPKEEYTTKEVYKMLGIAPSTFCGYKSNIDGFPEPIDPKNIPHKYNREAVGQIRLLVQNHKNSLIKNIPTKIKQTKKTTKKHRRM